MGIRKQHQGVERSAARRLAAVLLAGAGLAVSPASPRAEPPARLAPVEAKPRNVDVAASGTAMQAGPTGPTIRLVLPAARPAYATSVARKTERETQAPVRLAATVEAPVLALDLPAPALPAVSSDLVATAPAPTSSPVAIAQLSSPEDSSPDAIQLNEPSYAMALSFSDRIAAMQVAPLPAVRFSRTEQAALLAASPDRLRLRRGDKALGRVAFEVAATRAMALRLGDLLDLVGAELPADEFARLSQSAAADSFVPLETLRQAGIPVRYDAVYDEFVLEG